MTGARGESPVNHRPSSGSQSVADRQRRASVGSAPLHRRRRARAAPFTESPVQDHLDRVLACECPLHVLVQHRLRSRDDQQVTRCGLSLRQRSHLPPPRREVRVAGSAPSGLRPGGAGSERIPTSRKRASATHVSLPQAGHVLTPSSKHSSQSRHSATRRSGKCRCRRSVGASLLTAAEPRGIGRGELLPGHGQRWSARDTRRCAVSALEASSSVPLSCLRRPLGRTIGLNQPGAGTITLSKPLRKSRVADRILRLPAGRRGRWTGRRSCGGSARGRKTPRQISDSPRGLDASSCWWAEQVSNL